jgi:hypothetical protein
MSLYDELTQLLQAELPTATFVCDGAQSQVRWLDFTDSLEGVSVEIRENRGYGLHTSPEPGFGTGPDKVVTSAREVIDELKSLSIPAGA